MASMIFLPGAPEIAHAKVWPAFALSKRATTEMAPWEMILGQAMQERIAVEREVADLGPIARPQRLDHAPTASELGLSAELPLLVESGSESLVALVAKVTESPCVDSLPEPISQPDARPDLPSVAAHTSNVDLNIPADEVEVLRVDVPRGTVTTPLTVPQPKTLNVSAGPAVDRVPVMPSASIQGASSTEFPRVAEGPQDFIVQPTASEPEAWVLEHQSNRSDAAKTDVLTVEPSAIPAALRTAPEAQSTQGRAPEVSISEPSTGEFDPGQAGRDAQREDGQRQLRERIDDAALHRPGRIALRVRPEGIGEITISLRQVGGWVEAEATTAEDTVRRSLIEGREQLAQNLEARRLHLTDFRVREADPSGSESAFSSFADDRPARQGRADSVPSSPQRSGETVPLPQAVRHVGSSSGIEIWT